MGDRSWQWRIQDFPRGAPTPRGGGGGAPTYDFAKFSWKLHEIERIWVPGGGGATLWVVVISSGSSRRVGGGGARNMNSMRLSSAAIFFMTNFYRTGGGGGHGPLATPLDPLVVIQKINLMRQRYIQMMFS